MRGLDDPPVEGAHHGWSQTPCAFVTHFEDCLSALEQLEGVPQLSGRPVGCLSLVHSAGDASGWVHGIDAIPRVTVTVGAVEVAMTATYFVGPTRSVE